MAAFLEGLATGFDIVIQTTLQATVLAALILVLQRLLRKRLAPRWHYALWLLVLVRLFLPWTPESPTSVFNYVRTEQAAPTQFHLANPETDIVIFDSPLELSAFPPLPDVPIEVAPAAPTIRLTWTDWLRLVWLGVAGLLSMYVCVVNGSLWWRVRREPAIDDGTVATEFADCRRAMGIRASIRLIRTRHVSTPALLGLLRPRLLLPESMERALSREELRHVFLHELAHYRRGDLLVNWLMVACNTVHWFNPALWYAFHRMRADRELACDALAMSYIAPDETASYGRTLLRLLEHVARPHPLPGLVGVLERKSHLKKRIRGIAGFKPGSYRWSILAVALIAVLSAVALTNASTEKVVERSPQVAVALEDSDPLKFPVPSELKLEAGDSSKHEVDFSAPEPSIKVETEDRTITAESVQLDLESMRLDLITTVPLETNVEQGPRFRDLGGELQLATPENRRDLNVALVAQSVDLNTQRNNETNNPSDRPVVEVKDAEVSHDEAPQQKDGDVDAATSPPTEEEKWPDPPVVVRFGEGGTITADFAKLDTDNLILELGGTIIVDKDTGPDMRVTDGTAKLDLAEPRKGALSDVKGENVEVFQELPPDAPEETEKVYVGLGSGRRVLIQHTDGDFMANSMILDAETNEITLTGYVQFTSYGVRNGVADKVTFNYITGETQMERIRLEGMDLSRSESAESPAKVEKQDDTQDTPPPNPEVLAKLKAPVSLEFENERLFRIVGFISTYARVDIVIDNEVVAPVGVTPSENSPYVTDGVVPYVKLDNVSLKDALKAILRPLGLAYEVHGDTVFISTPDRLRAQEVVDETKKRVKFEDVKVSVSFNKGTTLMEAAAKLVEAAGVNIVVDRRVVNPDEGTSSDPTAWIVQPKKYKDTSLISVLREMLEPLGLTFAVQPGFIWISTADRIATESFEQLETRTYPLDRIPALNADGASRETFLATIRRMVRVREPNTDEAISNVRLDEERGVLVVHSTPSQLDDLERFLLNDDPSAPRSVDSKAEDAAEEPDWDSLPALSESERVQLGLPKLTINVVSLGTEQQPRASALINLKKVYVGDEIPDSGGTVLKEVDLDGIIVEREGRKYRVEKKGNIWRTFPSDVDSDRAIESAADSDSAPTDPVSGDTADSASSSAKTDSASNDANASPRLFEETSGVVEAAADIATNGPDAVLASLIASDDRFLSEFTLSAQVLWPILLMMPDSERIRERVTVARSDSTWVYRAEASRDTPTPNYQEIDSRAPAVDQGEDRGAYVVTRSIWCSQLWEEDFGGLRDLSRVLLVRPDGSVEERDTLSSRVTISKPVEPLQGREFYIILLTSGRGFSRYLERIDSVELLPDGLIRCEAAGHYPGENRVATTWELVIDPNASYLVRKAIAFFSGGGRFSASFENEGMQNCENGPLPETGRFRQGAAEIRERHFLGDGYAEIAYLSSKNSADRQLISDTQSLLRDKYPPGTRVVDLTKEPHRSYVVPENRKPFARRVGSRR